MRATSATSRSATVSTWKMLPRPITNSIPIFGIFARAAVDNDDNPRKVPGILASPDLIPGIPSVKYGSDKDMPSVFWITNGWNDFQGNMAAGAGLCGICYWQVPASISGHSRHQKWQSYAALQRCPRVKPSNDNTGDPPEICNRTGASPLMNFDGNYCTSAMMSFNTVGYSQDCPLGPYPGVGTDVRPISNPYAPRSSAWQAPIAEPAREPSVPMIIIRKSTAAI